MESRASSPVCSHNEWDPLEEVIVGRVEGATIPSSHPVVTHSIPRAAAWPQTLTAGLRHPGFLAKRALRELDGLVALLGALGVIVRRPEPIDHHKKFITPEWSSRGYCNMFPRDSLLVIGTEIIEAPMAWPCRHFEVHSYRAILKDYFQRGARWTAAPKPQLKRELFDTTATSSTNGGPGSVLTEFEPVFDAANIARCGRDLFILRSNVTNAFGIEWLRRHLGSGYRVHEIETRRPAQLHIDTVFMPLAPGKVLINPDHIDVARLPTVLKSWQILIAPEPDPITDLALRWLTKTCKWLSMNVLSVDMGRVIVDPHHAGMMRALERWGFEPIPCPFMHCAAFGGAFHCTTLDIRRHGPLDSYF